MAFTEDLTPYFRDWGVAATVDGVSCLGIFDNVYAQALGFTAGTTPTLIVKASDVTGAAQGEAVVVPAGSYTITAIEPDGTGLVLLRLQEA
jgi:hypothetical protein